MLIFKPFSIQSTVKKLDIISMWWYLKILIHLLYDPTIHPVIQL